jgi:hypothetical protein
MVGRPAWRAASSGGNAGSQRLASKRRPLTWSAARETTQGKGGTISSGSTRRGAAAVAAHLAHLLGHAGGVGAGAGVYRQPANASRAALGEAQTGRREAPPLIVRGAAREIAWQPDQQLHRGLHKTASEAKH